MTGKILCMKVAFNTHRDKLEEYAKEHGFEVVTADTSSREAYMKEFANNDVEIIVNTWYDAREMGGYTDDMIRLIAKSGVKAIVHQGAGYDVVGNILVWKEMGVQVANSPNSPASDTADAAMILAMNAMRNIHSYDASLRAGQWRGKDVFGLSLHGSTVGILGMGNIGKFVRDRCAGFPFEKVQYHQRTKLSTEEEKGAIYVKDLDTFLSTTDIIIVIVPYSQATHHLLNRERLLNVVKQNCVIVNVARGPVIDEQALVDALDSGRVFSCGLDVYENEPEVHPGLIANERTCLIPHIGGHTKYNWDSLELELLSNIKSFVETGHVISLVKELRD